MNITSKKVDFDTELKTTRHSDLRALVMNFKEISAEAQKLNNRKPGNRPFPKGYRSAYGIYGFYQLLKKVTKPIYEIFNNRSNSEKSIRKLKKSLNFLNILIRESVEKGLSKFKKQLVKLQELMISLFPKGEAFQLSLFDTEPYTEENKKKASSFQSFLDWLQDIRIFGFSKIESVEVKPVEIEQFNINFCGAY